MSTLLPTHIRGTSLFSKCRDLVADEIKIVRVLDPTTICTRCKRATRFPDAVEGTVVCHSCGLVAAGSVSPPTVPPTHAVPTNVVVPPPYFERTVDADVRRAALLLAQWGVEPRCHPSILGLFQRVRAATSHMSTMCTLEAYTLAAHDALLFVTPPRPPPPPLEEPQIEVSHRRRRPPYSFDPPPKFLQLCP